jgi:hypothetical protein
MAFTLPQQYIAEHCLLFDKTIILLNNYLVGAYKFDTETETFTSIDITNPNANCYYTTVNGIYPNVYLFNSSYNNKKIYKLNVETETITELSVETKDKSDYGRVPLPIYNHNIYIITRNGTIYKFDTITETITTMAFTLPTTRSNRAWANVNGSTYLLGGTGTDEIIKITNLS